MSGLTLSVTQIAGSTARYQLTNAEGVVVRKGAQRIHRTRRDRVLTIRIKRVRNGKKETSGH